MADHLLYWKTFWDAEYGEEKARKHVLARGYGSSAAGFRSVGQGSTVWIVVTNRAGGDEWRIAQQILVKSARLDDPEWRVLGDETRSNFFNIKDQPNAENLLKRLRFDTDRPIQQNGALIGRAIQGPRRLSLADSHLLRKVSSLLVAEPGLGEAENDPEASRRRRVELNLIYRNPDHVKSIKLLYGDTCQLCSDSIQLQGGRSYSEAHHIRPLGAPHHGPDRPENMLCVCPNCHVRLDYGTIRLDAALMRVSPSHGRKRTVNTVPLNQAA